MTSDPHPSDFASGPSAKPGNDASRSVILRNVFHERGSFASVDDETLVQLSSKMRPLHFRDGEIICEEGDPGDFTFIVVSGEVEVIKGAKDGALIQVNILRPGDWGGMMSLFNRTPRSAQLVARGNVEFHTLGHDDLTDLLETAPSLTMGLLTCMSRRLSEDAIHLAATLRYLTVSGYDEVYKCCTPQERIMLDTISHRAAAAESLNEIMEFLFDSIQRFGNCDRMTLAFLEDDRSRAVSYWTRASYEPLILRADHAEDLAGSSLEEVLITGRPSVINDLAQYAREHPNRLAPRLCVEEGLLSSITTPLVVGKRTVGFLVVRARSKDAFGEHDKCLYPAIISSISQMVEKDYRIEQLTQANSDYDEVLSFVSHELQSPIASMVTDAQLLEEGFLGKVNEKQSERLHCTIAKGQYLLTLVRDYLNLARLEGTSLKAQMHPEVDICRKVVEPMIDMIESECAEKEIKLDRCYQDPATVAECDIALMQIAFGNLLKNAVKYGRNRGEIRIIVETDRDRAILTVWNEGPGFANSEKNKLFRKFSRLDDPALKTKTGTGVGLYSTWRIMQLHRGRVAANSEQGKWAEFSLTLPIRAE